MKSAVINQLHNQRQKGQDIIPENVATSFQNSVVEVITTKAIHACKAYNVDRLIVAGGVASNRGLRESIASQCEQNNIQLTIPAPKLCTDNAAMIGAAGHYLYLAGKRGDMAMNGQNNIDIEDFTIESTL